jgi:hypothetical protein
MEKSIETIWKEGFLKNDALLAPKLNNLYNQKSIHLVDKFKRMYHINWIAIIVFVCVLIPVSILVKIPYMGIPMALLFFAVLFINRKLKIKLNTIDKTENSYQYLISFKSWVKELVQTNTKLSRFLYPYVLLSLIAGFWFGGFGGNIPGNEFVNNLLVEYPNTYLVFGIPLVGILIVLFGIGLLAFFGGIIGKWDLNLVYGGILKKLDVLIFEMEDLQNKQF